VLGVDQQRRFAAVFIDLHRMVDHQVDRLEWVDPLRAAAEPRDGVAHRGEVDHRRHAGEVLEEDPARSKCDLLLCLVGGAPGGECGDVLRLHEGVVLVAQEVLEQHLQADGELPRPRPGDAVQGVEAEDRVAGAVDIE
jgi:hypothetical protein